MEQTLAKIHCNSHQLLKSSEKVLFVGAFNSFIFKGGPLPSILSDVAALVSVAALTALSANAIFLPCIQTQVLELVRHISVQKLALNIYR